MLIDVNAWTLLDRLDPEGGWTPTDSPDAPPSLVEVRQASGSWSARLTVDGVAAVAFRAVRDAAAVPCPAWLAKQGIPGFRELSLTPCELDVLRMYASLPGRPGAAGLTAVIAEAHHSPSANRWLVQVSEAETAEVGRALWLDALSGQVTARNRIARQYRIRYEPGCGAVRPWCAPHTPAQ